MSTATFRLHPTPIGEMLLVARPSGLIGAEVLHRAPEHALEELTWKLGTVPMPGDVGTAPTQLDEYFARRRRHFTLPLHWELARGFTVRALEAVRSLPYGERASYGDVAVMAGAPGAGTRRGHRVPGDPVLRHRAGAPRRTRRWLDRPVRRAPRDQAVPARS